MACRNRPLRSVRLKLTDQSVVVLGAGGAARACLSELLRARVGHIRIINRTPAKAEKLVKSLPLARHRPLVEVDSLTELKEISDCTPPSLIINATSATPARLCKIIASLVHRESADRTVLWDLNYGSRALPPESVPESMQYVDGLYMLAAQAAESFSLWTGRRLEYKTVYRFLQRKSKGR